MSERTIWRALIFHLFDHKMEINDDKLFENKFDTTEVCFFAKFGCVQLSLIINNNPKLALTFESILFFANSYLIEWNSKKWSKTFWTSSLNLADKTKNKMLRFVAQKKLEKTATKMAHTKHWAIRFPHSRRVPFLGPDPFQFVLKSVNQFFSPIFSINSFHFHCHLSPPQPGDGRRAEGILTAVADNRQQQICSHQFLFVILFACSLYYLKALKRLSPKKRKYK